MATLLTDLSPADMQNRLDDALSVYVDAMHYPRGTERQRASMWLEHTRRDGWTGVAAFDVPSPEMAEGGSIDSAPMLGVAYGYRGAPDQWWYQQVATGLRQVGTPGERIDQLMSGYFELTELHIHPRAQGHGLGEALTRRLLAGAAESHVLLSTPEILGEGNRAWRLYRRLGFHDVMRSYFFPGDPRPFAILGRALPL
ncbi:GNAT family N-acetyltransferase [Mycolicibacterium aubagnense]|uniref:N-acetyltransferase n=1 Tax=Mycolicibacterium aubagnense TaxID=319707 RepID=A0ABN5YZJ2_9MYCO|nr:GNAT family N-acetyltransferase [Mycolicibacterium aubagnense]TLH66027.1 GNAT family N-acetyltransferase [Mycolicibacterium aubagnense]WGI31262.1 GNAT family N-acetyltransferase [Mycolicibacterium aubagnense]BBX87333.1 N-acetyltransferase [Mycolicibacterium aubagnense]